MYEITMPRLSDSMEEGKIIQWKVRPGDAVREGDILAEIESDKAVMELESFHDGVVGEIVHGAGDEVPVGQVIAYVLTKGEKPVASPPPAAAPVPAAVPQREEPHAAVREQPAVGDRVLISPYARKLAESHGIDITKLKGSGPHGRIVAADVELIVGGVAPAPHAEAAAPPAVGEAMRVSQEEVRPASEPDMEPLAAALLKRFRLEPRSVSGTGPRGLILVEDVVAVLCVRSPELAKPADEQLPALDISDEEAEVEEASFRLRTQARHVTAAKHVIPHFYLTMSVDAERLLEVRAALKEKFGATVTHLVMLACIKALRRHPEVNRSYDRGRVLKWKHVNLGLAVETEQGLTVAVLARAETLTLQEIVGRTRDMADKARQGRLSPEERRHPTFTISNLGMFQVEQFAAVLSPPASMTLAVGAAMPAPIVRGSGIFVGREIKLTASCDHRIIDGVQAAAFMRDLKAILEEPQALLGGTPG